MIGNLLHGSRNQRPLYEGTPDSLKAYTVPGWFADARFGFWFHWGLQSAVGDGDWYARFVYIEGSPQHEYHLKRFGPQSKVDYKNLISLFMADQWDPDYLMDLYGRPERDGVLGLNVQVDKKELDKESVPAVIQLHLSRFRNRRG